MGASLVGWGLGYQPLSAETPTGLVCSSPPSGSMESCSVWGELLVEGTECFKL